MMFYQKDESRATQPNPGALNAIWHPSSPPGAPATRPQQGAYASLAPEKHKQNRSGAQE